MELHQFVHNGSEWTNLDKNVDHNPNLGFLFGGVQYFRDGSVADEIREFFPDIILVGCTTAGEITNKEILEDSLVLTTVGFEKTKVHGASVIFDSAVNVYQAGRRVAKKLPKDDLTHAIVFSEGLDINGSDLVKGITEELPENVQLTGGLAGDANEFEQTYVLFDGHSSRNKIAIVGLYGDSVEIGHGCFGGWDPFGPDRLITKSDENILYELDGQPALDLYKKYLGDYASQLPSSGLLFPLAIMDNERQTGLVRTILGIDEEKKSLTFAGDVPEGRYARLMKSNNHRLIDGAHQSAKNSVSNITNKEPDLALICSCVGRKLVLKQRTEEELEVLREVYGNRTMLTGYYSYGEIAPVYDQTVALLHNQTMCITTISEK